jgi:large subunit ribosomal protein L29
MEADEIRDLSTDEIVSHLEDAREELMKLRFQTATGELQDTNQLKATRQLIARLLTIMNERSSEPDMEGEA